MIEYLNGSIIELSPAHAVVDVQGLGYHVVIPLGTYSIMHGHQVFKLYIHEAIREDAHTLYGFHNKDERELFRMLISVSGVGSSTGILMLSSLSASELRGAIVSSDIDRLKSIKGIGLKTAQRIVVELKDKMSKESSSMDIFMSLDNSARDEALSAMVTLGFVKKNIEKVIDKIVRDNPSISVENIIKDALKQM